MNAGTGRNVTVTVIDTCPPCGESIGTFPFLPFSSRVVMRYCSGADAWCWISDLSPEAFQELTGGNLDPPGKFDVEW